MFGGFTPLNWKNKGFWIRDLNNQTFLFSLDLKKKYKSTNENTNGIFCVKLVPISFSIIIQRQKKRMMNMKALKQKILKFIKYYIKIEINSIL